MNIKNGIIVLNKEAGMSSNTAVNKVKYLVGAKKAGHLGTLDVLGEGVLPITLNNATRLFDYFLKKDKTYRAVFAFGIETTTLDCEGELTNISYRNINLEEIENAIKKFIGKVNQTPPQYSALKVKGKTAYEVARRGGKVELKPREVEIYSFKLLREVKGESKERLISRFFRFHDIDLLENKDIKNSLEKNLFEFEITCSSGTYIRALCRDLAQEIYTYGTMLSIIRTRCGNFSLQDSKTLKDIEKGEFDIIDVEKVIDLPSIFISKKDGKDVLDGKRVLYLPIQKQSFKLYSDNVFFGIANNIKDGILFVETFLKGNNE